MVVGVSSQQLIESLTLGNVVTALVVLTFSSFIVDFTRKPRYTDALPRVGCGGSFLGTLKNWVFFVTRYNSWVSEGYEKARYTPRAPLAPSLFLD